MEPDAAAVPELALARDLYERHSHTILAFCYSRLGSREDAEDAAQTTFLNAFRSLQRGVVPELELAWLLKIANHAILNRRRAASRRRRVETPHDPEILQGVAPALERDADELIGLERALAAMPEQQRHALLLREWKGLSYREIREELGLSQAALEALLFRARRSLAVGLEQPHRVRTQRRLGDPSALLTGVKALLTGGVSSQLAVASIAVVGTVVGATVPGQPTPRPSRHGRVPTAAAPLAAVLGGVHTRTVGTVVPLARTVPAAAIASLPAARLMHPATSSHPAGPAIEPTEAVTVLSDSPATEEMPAVAPSLVPSSDAPPTAPTTPQTDLSTPPMTPQTDMLSIAPVTAQRELQPTVPLLLQSDVVPTASPGIQSEALTAAAPVPQPAATPAARTGDESGAGSSAQLAAAPGRTGLTPANGSQPPDAAGVAPRKASAADGTTDGTAAPGRSGPASGRTGLTPANGSQPPDAAGVAAGKSSAADGATDGTAAPGRSGSAPGRTGSTPANGAPPPGENDAQGKAGAAGGVADATPASGNSHPAPGADAGKKTDAVGGTPASDAQTTTDSQASVTTVQGPATLPSAASPAEAAALSAAASGQPGPSPGNSSSATVNVGVTQHGNQSPTADASGGASEAAGKPTEPSPTIGAAAETSVPSNGNGSRAGGSGNGKTH